MIVSMVFFSLLIVAHNLGSRAIANVMKKNDKMLATSNATHLRRLFLRGLVSSSVRRFVLSGESALLLSLDFLILFNTEPREVGVEESPSNANDADVTCALQSIQ